MPKLKDILPSFLGGNSSKDITSLPQKLLINGGLETDAVPVDDDNSNSRNANVSSSSVNSTPTASAELTDSVVRELSDPNYNSLEVATLSPPDANAVAVRDANAGAMALPPSSAIGSTMNTMNVNNAQQQLVVNFSNVNKLHLGSVYNINSNVSTTSTNSRKNSNCSADVDSSYNASDSGGGKRQLPRKTTSIVAMMQSRDEPEHRMLDTIATHLGEGWKQVMRDLGLSEGQIDQALIDHQMHGGIKEVIYQMLLMWIRNADDGVATLGHITSLLWETNHRDCVERMKYVYKSVLHGKTAR